MARKKSQARVVEAEPVANASDAAAAGYVEDELELLQVDLGDMVKMKQVLDEAVAAAVLEKVPEDYLWDNFKLSIMAAACFFAMIAQFAPIPFPESRPVLGVCGSIYFLLSGLLQFITTFIDKDSILLTKPVEESASTTVKNKDMKKYGIRVRSSLPRFSEWYTVILEFQMKNAVSPKVEQKWSVGKFFDKEGYFDEEGLTQEIDLLFQRFEAGKYDKMTDDKKKKKE